MTQIRLILLIGVLLFISILVNAQVTIGSGRPPLKGLLLDLKENDEIVGANSTKGFGLPRVILESPNKLTIDDDSKAKDYIGSVVYNVKESQGLDEGLYFWNGEIWHSNASPGVVFGEAQTSGITLKFESDSKYYPTGFEITLPPGLWRIDVNILLRKASGKAIPPETYIWIRSSFSDTNKGDGTDELSEDLRPKSKEQKVSGAFMGPTPDGDIYDLLIGSLFIHNNGSQDKTYYYVAGDTDAANPGGTELELIGFGSMEYGENFIIATSVNFK